MRKGIISILLLAVIIGIYSATPAPIRPSSPYIFSKYVKVLLDSLVTQGVVFESRDTFINVPAGRIGMCFKNDTLYYKIGASWISITPFDSTMSATMTALKDSISALESRLLDSIAITKVDTAYLNSGMRGLLADSSNTLHWSDTLNKIMTPASTRVIVGDSVYLANSNVLKADNVNHTLKAYTDRASLGTNGGFISAITSQYSVSSITPLTWHGVFQTGCRGAGTTAAGITSHSYAGSGVYGWTQTGTAIRGVSNASGYGIQSTSVSGVADTAHSDSNKAGAWSTTTGTKIGSYYRGSTEVSYISKYGRYFKGSDSIPTVPEVASMITTNKLDTTPIYNSINNRVKYSDTLNRRTAMTRKGTDSLYLSKSKYTTDTTAASKLVLTHTALMTDSVGKSGNAGGIVMNWMRTFILSRFGGGDSLSTNYKLLTHTQNAYNVSDTVSTDMTNVYTVTFSKAYREHRIDTLSSNATVTISKSALAKPGAVEVFYSLGTGAAKTINFGTCKNACIYDYDDTAGRMNVITFKLSTGGRIERCVYQRY